ncbi:hypothetical protein V6N13_047950 [Hibiscus sabdariffa]
MEALCNALNKVKPYLAMVSLQFGYAGMYIVSMVCLKHGMSNFILATYRHVVATIVVAPFAFVLERFLFLPSLFRFKLQSQSIAAANIDGNGDRNCGTTTVTVAI